MAMEKAVEYVILLNVKPDNGKNLSPAQVNTICKQLEGIDLNEVKRSLTALFHAESEQNKGWADRINRVKPINKTEQAEMINRTHEIADKIVRVYNNLDEITQALKSTQERNSPPKEILIQSQKRLTRTESMLFKKSGTN